MSNNQKDEKTASKIVTGLESGPQTISEEVIPNSLPTESQLLTGKRANSEELVTDHLRKRRKSEEMESALNHNHVLSHENKDTIGSSLKSVEVMTPVVVNNQNPLTERNIRVDSDNNIALNTPSLENSKPSAKPTEDIDNINNCDSNMNSSEKTGSIESTKDTKNETKSLSSAITSLEKSQKTPQKNTLDYVARLPDGCSRQLEEQTPAAQDPCSGDEDDDNYLDSSEGEDNGEDDSPYSKSNNDEDESCGEGEH